MSKYNKRWILGTILLLVISFSSYITFKMVGEYRHNLVVVTEKRIIEAAKKCFDEDVCSGTETTLLVLYAKNYLSVESHPLTKEVYKDTSIIRKTDRGYEFIPYY